MKHIHTFENFLNESKVKDPKLIKGADITIEMDDEDGDFSAGDYRVTGLTRGGVILDGMGKRNLQVSFGALNDAGYTINENFLNESSTGKVEITKDVKTAYDLWNDSSFFPGKLYRFSTGLKDPRDILNSFAHELEAAKLVKIYSYGHPYEEAIKWLEKNIK